MGIKSCVEKGLLEVWGDVFDARMDDQAAPDLSDVISGKRGFYSDPDQFFQRTHLTRGMREVLEDVARVLSGDMGGATFILTSLFGGGKTHTQILLYHALNTPEKLSALDEELAARIAEVGEPLIVIMDCSRASMVPHPQEPCEVGGFSIKTIWGMLAYKLGAYAKVKHLDSGKAPAPDVDLLKKILSEPGEPVVILLDEIVHYVFNMERSERLRDYAGKVLLFLDYLSRAVEQTPRVVLVASVQADYRKEAGQMVLHEESMFRGVAGRVFRNLQRESTRIIVPVAPRDVVSVLKKRIFRKIDPEAARRARDMLYGGYRENPELFGVETDWHFAPEESGRVMTARDTYPFHPKYVEVLQEFIPRNPDLQKTRDAIRITRKVIRHLWRSREDPSFIMPWHIDLRRRDIRRMVLTARFGDFNDAVSRDVVSEEGRLGSVSECEKPLLALRIAMATFLKTYTYETFKEPLKVFPDLKDICLMTYDPETFSAENLQPADIKSVLEDMVRKLPHFVNEEGRYWFTPFASVLEHVEKRADELMRESNTQLHRTVEENIRSILISRRRGVEEKSLVFSEKNAVVIGYAEEPWLKKEIEDTPVLKLVVYAKPEIEEEEIRKIIFSAGGASRRIYRNTVAVLLPKEGYDFSRLLTYASKINAAREVQGKLEEYFRDRDIRSIQESKLKKYLQGCEENLKHEILSAFTRIAYPVREGTEDAIRYVQTAASNSLISQVEAGLSDPGTGPKIRVDFSFDELRDFIKTNLGVDLVETDEPVKRFDEIITLFYTNPSAPFTTRESIEAAIRSGVERGEIGVWQDGRLYWKEIEPDEMLEVPRLKGTAEIYSYRRAARMLAEKLKEETGEFREGRIVKRVWFEVEVLGKTFKLDDLLGQSGWEEMLKSGRIRRREETIERGFLLKIEPSFIKAGPNEEVKAKVIVEQVGDYDLRVELKSARGSLTPPSGTPPFTSELNLGLLPIGMFTYEVKAVGEDGVEATETINVNIESEEWSEITTDNLSTVYVRSSLIGISPSDLLTCRLALDAISKGNLKARANVTVKLGERISVSMNGEDSRIAALCIQQISNLERMLPSLKTSVSGEITFEEPPTVDSQMITLFSSLNRRARFRLLVKKK